MQSAWWQWEAHAGKRNRKVERSNLSRIIDKARVNEALPVEAEIEVLQKLRHEHIVRLYDSFETKHSYV